MLVAQRLYKSLLDAEGTFATPMLCVMRMRGWSGIRFQLSPSILMVLYSASLGSPGLTILHFIPCDEESLLLAGSTNANFNTDFSPSAQLPPAKASCESFLSYCLLSRVSTRSQWSSGARMASFSSPASDPRVRVPQSPV